MLQGSGIEAVKACPTCRTPLGQVLRYGRPLNHAKVQQADMKFFLQCSGALLQADKDSNHASKVAADWTARAGTQKAPSFSIWPAANLDPVEVSRSLDVVDDVVDE